MRITRRCKKPEEYENLVSALGERKLLRETIPESNIFVCENCPEAKELIEIHAPGGLTDRGTFV